MDYSEVYDVMNYVEETVPVNDIKLGEEFAWPLIKASLFSKLFHSGNCRGKPTPVYSRMFAHLKRARYFIRSLTLLFKQADVCVLSTGEGKVAFNGTQCNPYTFELNQFLQTGHKALLNSEYLNNPDRSRGGFYPAIDFSFIYGISASLCRLSISLSKKLGFKAKRYEVFVSSINNALEYKRSSARLSAVNLY